MCNLSIAVPTLVCLGLALILHADLRGQASPGHIAAPFQAQAQVAGGGGHGDEPCNGRAVLAALAVGLACRRGRGAQLNGRRIRASKRATLDGAQVFGGGNQNREDLTDFDRGQTISRYLFSQGATNYTQLSNNMALAYVAAGRIDTLWHSNIDDTADAGLLLVLESGALAADFAGGSAMNNGELVCANAKLLKLMLKALHSA